MEESLKMGEVMPPAQRNRQRVLLIGIVVLFFSPMIVAWIVYGYMQGGASTTATRNHGQLLEPARALHDFTLQRAGGGRYQLADMRGQWTLVYFGGQHCERVCQHTLYALRQSRLAQGGEMKRVSRVYVAAADAGAKSLDAVLKAFPGTTVLSGSAKAVADFSQQFVISPGKGGEPVQSVYIVDPLGNIVMHYAPDFDPRGLIKDLEVLLKVSQIG